MTKLITDDDLNNKNYIPDPIFLKERNLQILKITWLDQIKCKKTKIKNSETCRIYEPKFNIERNPFNNVAPKVFLYELNEYYAKTGGSNFQNANEIVIERMESIPINICNYRAGNLITHGESKALVHIPKDAIQIDQPALFLGGNGSFNYYHLLIELFTKLLITPCNTFKKNNIKTIILNDKVKEIEPFNQMLNCFLALKKIDFEILYFNSNQNLYLKKLFIINSPNLTLYNSKERFSSPSYCTYSITTLQSLRKSLLQLKSKPPTTPPQKIFLLRNPKHLSQHNKRNYNEEEIYSFFKQKGYHGVLMEEYSFEEQIYIFNNAKRIAGPTGAFWANILFCQEGSTAISWLNSNANQFSCYSTLAKYFGCDLSFIESVEEDSKILHGKYNLPVKKLIEFTLNKKL